MRGTRWRTAGGEVFTALLAIEAAVLSLNLVFDPRYRSFPVDGFLFAAALLFLVGLRSVVRAAGWRAQLEQGREEWLLETLLLVCAVAIGVAETLANIQAMGWCAACALLGTALWLRAGLPRTPASR